MRFNRDRNSHTDSQQSLSRVEISFEGGVIDCTEEGSRNFSRREPFSQKEPPKGLGISFKRSKTPLAEEFGSQAARRREGQEWGGVGGPTLPITGVEKTQRMIEMSKSIGMHNFAEASDNTQEKKKDEQRSKERSLERKRRVQPAQKMKKPGVNFALSITPDAHVSNTINPSRLEAHLQKSKNWLTFQQIRRSRFYTSVWRRTKGVHLDHPWYLSVQ